MQKILLIFILIAANKTFSQNLKIDSVKEARNKHILSNLPAVFNDSSTIIVVNELRIGSLKEIKKDLPNLFSSLILDSVELISSTKRFSYLKEKVAENVIHFILAKKAISKSNPIYQGEENNKPMQQEMNEPWRKHLERWINPFQPVENKAPDGSYTPLLMFKVDTNGKVSDLLTLTNYGYGTEEQLIRAILRYTNYKPTYQNGKAVISRRIQPVKFVVNQDLRMPQIGSNSKYADSIYAQFKISTNKIKAGQENLIEINVTGVYDKDLEIILSNGTITRISIGRYRARVEEIGKVKMTIWKYKKRKKEFVGEAEINVE